MRECIHLEQERKPGARPVKAPVFVQRPQVNCGPTPVGVPTIVLARLNDDCCILGLVGQRELSAQNHIYGSDNTSSYQSRILQMHSACMHVRQGGHVAARSMMGQHQQ